MKRCRGCHLDLADTEFYVNRKRSNKNGAPWRFSLCRSCLNKKRKEERKHRAQAGLCRLCSRRKQPNSTLCVACAQKQARREVERQGKDKRDAFAAYGGAICRCCGETMKEFLTIDHINGGGRHHRQEIGPRLYAWLRRHAYPSGFQVLCMNCNFAKGQHGVCPHETALSVTLQENAAS